MVDEDDKSEKGEERKRRRGEARQLFFSTVYTTTLRGGGRRVICVLRFQPQERGWIAIYDVFKMTMVARFFMAGIRSYLSMRSNPGGGERE